jgi:hypothetical protein
MTVDRYTKAVLTVIAGCLLWLCAMGGGRTVSAQQQAADLSTFKAAVQPVVIVGTGSMDQDGNISLKLAADGRRRTDPTLAVALPYSKDRPLPVSIPYDAANPLPTAFVHSGAQPLPVQINGIERGKTWDPIRVDVEDARVRSRPGGGDR